MSTSPINLNIPPGRLVAGSLYKPNTTDFDGNPLVVKTGPNAGQARVQFFFGVAVPKLPGHTHWSQTEWGAKIWALGHAAFPQAAQRADFAWKIEDGDSTALNKRNKRPCDNVGYPGHWIVRFSGGFPPKIYRTADGGGIVPELTEGYIKPGYYVEVNFDCAGNDNANNPGVYLNYQGIMFRAYGEEINFGIDPNVAFGGQPSALPAGASATPLPSSTPILAPPSPPVPAPVPVAPNPQFLNIPAIPGAVAAPAPPPPPVPIATGPKMTAAAGATSYVAFKAAGWSDEQLIAAGFMIA